MNINNNGAAVRGGALRRVFGPRPVSTSIYIANLRRYWPGAALMLLVYLVYALTLFVGISNPAYRSSTWAPEPAYMSIVASPMFGMFAFAAGLVVAILCFHYMMNPREAIMSHSLPIKRESHLLSTAASGFTLLGAPIVAGGALFFAVYASVGRFFGLEAMHWTFANLSVAFLGFSIAAFFAMLTGNSIAHGVLALIFINLPIMVEAVLYSYCERFFFGFASRELLTRHINPFYHIFEYFDGGARGYSFAKILPSVLTPLLFLLAGLVFLAPAALLYRRRSIETAGDIISMRQVRPFLRYGVALGVAFMFGLIYNGVAYGSNYSPAWEIIFSVVGGAVGFFIAEMFIRRTIHVFRRHYMGAVGFAIVYVAVFLSIYYDAVGYGRMRLDADAIDYIVIYDISPRVKQAIKGETLSYSGTMSDLDIYDPGGYLEGRPPSWQYSPKGPIPKDIARQIIERDHTVLRGADALAAVEFQHFIADNHKYFDSRLSADLQTGRYSFNANYTRTVPFIARYKDGRIVERNYYVSMSVADVGALRASPDLPESKFFSHLYDIQYINMVAVRQNYVNGAAMAEYIQLDFLLNIAEKYLLGRDGAGAGAGADAGTDAGAISPGSPGRMILNRGQWSGLPEAYQLDGIQQGARGSYMDIIEYAAPWNTNEELLATITIMMPDGYEISIRAGMDEENVLAWLVQRGYISEAILND